MQASFEDARYAEEFIKTVPHGVTVFGSAREMENSLYYKRAYSLGKLLAERNIAVITGGGPGIMQAANHGAHDARGVSVGININLPFEQDKNCFTTKNITVKTFSLRKHLFVTLSAAYAVFPGGFGTLDEFAEIITLVQTEKIPPIPIALCGKSFWEGLLRWFEQLKGYNYISPKDMSIFTIMEEPVEIADYLSDCLDSDKGIDCK
ncbi:MAG: TIGR00730 family Rossman fold protein [Deferribacteraceae bacterium]|jgi:uncharacterized protein (TIGR00730 family)|nr:TIGR00730 family Rossman fold protein [Deferribacteraceae bacterium]